MVLLKRFLILASAAVFCGFSSGPAMGAPISVGPPPVVDGKPVPMPTVKKWGQYWYPASLVGYNRGIDFAYDQATKKLYADGSELELDTLLVEGVVYIPLKPDTGADSLHPGMDALVARRETYERMELPESAGRTDALFMENDVDMPDHPWVEERKNSAPSGPVVNLDATSDGRVPAHLREGALPPQQPPAALPGTLPRPGTVPVESPPVTSQTAPPSPATAGHGIPTRVTTQGGPPVTVAQQPVAMEPIPYQAPTTISPAASENQEASSPQTFTSSKSQNQVFEVTVVGGDLRASAPDRLLRIKLLQKNLSPVAQANLGTFSVRCESGKRVEPVRSRSVLADGVLAPGQGRQGELLFRLAPTEVPQSLELEGTIPLTVPLKP